MQNSQTIFNGRASGLARHFAFAPAARLKTIPWEVDREIVEKLKAIAGEVELAFCWLVANVSRALLPYRSLAFPAAMTALVGLAAGYLLGLVK